MDYSERPERWAVVRDLRYLRKIHPWMYDTISEAIRMIEEGEKNEKESVQDQIDIRFDVHRWV